MRHIAHLAGLAIVALALFATTGVAAASSTDTDLYKTSMAPFTTVIDGWAAQVDQAAHDAEMGAQNDEQLAELARIAGWMAADLQGTARLAPATVAPAHEQLKASVIRLGDAATVARTNPAKATLTIAQELPAFRTALASVSTFCATPLVKGPGIQPVTK